MNYAKELTQVEGVWAQSAVKKTLDVTEREREREKEGNKEKYIKRSFIIPTLRQCHYGARIKMRGVEHGRDEIKIKKNCPKASRKYINW